MQDHLTIFILDDEKQITEGIKLYLEQQGFHCKTFNTPGDYFHAVKNKLPDISLLDIKLPGNLNGLDVLKKSKQLNPTGEYIMISGHGGMDDVITAMREGAFDYIPKPFDMKYVEQAIKKTHKYLRYKRDYEDLQSRYKSILQKINLPGESKITGKSEHIKEVLTKMNQVAVARDTPVLITGESGTGKELVAQGIHSLSERRKNIFYPVNMTALTDTLLESQLFGHKKGAFTGATSDKKGIFRSAENGTVFLDEIGDMDTNTQAKLLRLLEEKQVYPVGSDVPYEIDCRILAATNKDITQALEDKEFREDLFYRLNVFRIHLKPLRERREDIPLLFDHFTELLAHSIGRKIYKIEPKVYEILMQYAFPGNARELKNIAEHAIILAEEGVITPGHFPDIFNNQPGTKNDDFSTLNINELERQAIKKALVLTKNNKSQAASHLGLTWQALDRKMKKYGL